MKILYLCQSPGYEYRFFKGAASELSFDFAAAIKAGPRNFVRQVLENMDPLEDGFPRSKTSFLSSTALSLTISRLILSLKLKPNGSRIMCARAAAFSLPATIPGWTRD